MGRHGHSEMPQRGEEGRRVHALMPDSRMLTVDEAADVLRCSRRTVERRVDSGALLATRNGRRVLIPAVAIRAFVNANAYRPDRRPVGSRRLGGSRPRRLWR